MTIVRNIAPILETATAQTRTQASYFLTNVEDTYVAMTSELDLQVTIPSGASKNLLSWDVYGEQQVQVTTSFVVYRKVDAGAFTVLPASQNGTNDYWSCIARPVVTQTSGYAPVTTTISIQDLNLPAVGSVVTYRLYLGNPRGIDASGTFYLNRCISSAGAKLYPAGSSSGLLLSV